MPFFGDNNVAIQYDLVEGLKYGLVFAQHYLGHFKHLSELNYPEVTDPAIDAFLELVVDQLHSEKDSQRRLTLAALKEDLYHGALVALQVASALLQELPQE
jgi:hypothetical protein